MDFKELLRTANLLSLVRIPLAIIMVVFFDNKLLFVMLFVLALLSDKFDGIVARKRGPTKWGANIDGFCDKIFFGIIFIFLMVNGILLWWHVLVLLIRDIAVALLALFVLLHPKRH
ncbi:CDP-alcohol phosphatidyltransferase family protein, partial [Candidatus Woesearchaeota archaeon]|nr:CDP-alcohol phosphatidyltransferase family protein [Candidatus Woesearchaeota archaeon]